MSACYQKPLYKPPKVSCYLARIRFVKRHVSSFDCFRMNDVLNNFYMDLILNYKDYLDPLYKNTYYYLKGCSIVNPVILFYYDYIFNANKVTYNELAWISFFNRVYGTNLHYNELALFILSKRHYNYYSCLWALDDWLRILAVYRETLLEELGSINYVNLAFL